MAIPVRIKTITAYGEDEYFDKKVNEWLERNKDTIEVIGISSSCKPGTGKVYMATVTYKGEER